jgi:hypothetical protein
MIFRRLVQIYKRQPGWAGPHRKSSERIGFPKVERHLEAAATSLVS